MRVNGADSTHIHDIGVFAVGYDRLKCCTGIIDVNVFNLRSCILMCACAHEQRYQKEIGCFARHL